MRMVHIIRSEMTKIVTLPSTWVTTFVLFVAFLFFQYQVFGVYTELADSFKQKALTEVYVLGELKESMEASIFNPGILLVILGSVIAGSEFKTGQFGMSVVAVPNRSRLIVGKFVAAFLCVLILSLSWFSVAFLFVYFGVRDTNITLFGMTELSGSFFRILLFAVAFTLFPIGLTLIARRTLFGVVSSMVMIMLTMMQVVAFVSPKVDALLPLSAARNLLLQGTDNPVPLTGTSLQGGIVLLGWIIVSFAGATIILKRRDAR